ncbi:MAG TPA: A24 family peptidase [Xanthobacteraceae bacterium]|nr:A24 family peptidase [Xanthobacteraceae bacterium]
MDLSSVRDAGTPLRGNVLVIVLIGTLAVGLSFAASPDWRGVFGSALALQMLAIAVSDIRHFIVPDILSASAFILGLIFAGLFDDAPLAEAILTCLLRAAAAALPLLALMLLYEWWRGRPGLGLGDVKLAAVAGAWLDWITIVAAIEVAALAALAAYGVWRYVLRRPIVATTPLPFGLFLAPAIWAGWLAEAALARYQF